MADVGGDEDGDDPVDGEVVDAADATATAEDTLHSKHPGMEDARNRTASGFNFRSDNSHMLRILFLFFSLLSLLVLAQ